MPSNGGERRQVAAVTLIGRSREIFAIEIDVTCCDCSRKKNRIGEVNRKTQVRNRQRFRISVKERSWTVAIARSSRHSLANRRGTAALDPREDFGVSPANKRAESNRYGKFPAIGQTTDVSS